MMKILFRTIFALMFIFPVFRNVANGQSVYKLSLIHIYILMQDRFILFLQAYHKIFPLTEREILLLEETYRFFLLTYVIKHGRYFFHEVFATKLQRETFDIHLPSIEKKFDPKPLLKALNL